MLILNENLCLDMLGCFEVCVQSNEFFTRFSSSFAIWLNQDSCHLILHHGNYSVTKLFLFYLARKTWARQDDLLPQIFSCICPDTLHLWARIMGTSLFEVSF